MWQVKLLNVDHSPCCCSSEESRCVGWRHQEQCGGSRFRSRARLNDLVNSRERIMLRVRSSRIPLSRSSSSRAGWSMGRRWDRAWNFIHLYPFSGIRASTAHGLYLNQSRFLGHAAAVQLLCKFKRDFNYPATKPINPKDYGSVWC